MHFQIYRIERALFFGPRENAKELGSGMMPKCPQQLSLQFQLSRGRAVGQWPPAQLRPREEHRHRQHPEPATVCVGPDPQIDNWNRTSKGKRRIMCNPRMDFFSASFDSTCTAAGANVTERLDQQPRESTAETSG